MAKKKMLDGKGPFGDNVFKNPARRFWEMSSIDAKWPETSFVSWRTLKDWQNSSETHSQIFENHPLKFAIIRVKEVKRQVLWA